MPYIAKWEIEVEATTAQAAAIEALDCIINGTSRCFDVRVKGRSNSEVIDLMELGQESMPGASMKRGYTAMYNALQEALAALNTAPRFNVGKTTSYQIAGKIERIIRQISPMGTI